MYLIGIGDDGPLHAFETMAGLTAFLVSERLGRVVRWNPCGFDTCDYHGLDCVRVVRVSRGGIGVQSLGPAERERVAWTLQHGKTSACAPE